MIDAFRYRVSGWRIQSERELPFFWPDDEQDAPPDVEVRFAALADAPPGGEEHGPFVFHSPRQVDFERAGVKIRIEDGAKLTVQQAADGDAAELHTFLAGPAFAILAHQRRSPPLHAGAVTFGDCAIAVAGHSGAGKSTTTRALIQRGARMLSDDQLIVDASTGLAHAAYPSTKLWSASAELLGHSIGEAPRVMRGLDKFHFQANEAFAPGSHALRGIVLLAREEGGSCAHIRRLTSTEAVPALSSLTHYRWAAHALGMDGVVFLWAARLAEHIPTYLLLRPADGGGVEQVIDCVLNNTAIGL